MKALLAATLVIAGASTAGAAPWQTESLTADGISEAMNEASASCSSG